MKILDRHLMKNFLFFLFAGTLLFIFIFLIVDMSDNLTSYIESGRRGKEIFLIYFYQIPSLILLLFPIGGLVALFFTVGMMVRNNELTAVKAAGISMYRFMTPIFILVFALSVILFLFNETAVVKSNKRYREIKEHEIFALVNSRDFVVFQDKRTIFKGEFFSAKTGKLSKPELYFFREDGRIERKIKGETGFYNNGIWYFEKATDISMKMGEEKITAHESMEMISLLNIKPEEILIDRNNTDIYSIKSIMNTINSIKKSGYEYRKHSTEIAYRFYYILVNLIIILIGSSFVINIKNTGIAFGLSLSILISFIYWGFLQGFRSAAESGGGNAFLLLLVPNIIFIIVGSMLFVYARK
ncbi:MAG: LptF/LptG family permease [bacterium]